MIAKTLSEIVKHPLVSRALNRREPIEDIIEDALVKWDNHMLKLFQKRNPAPAHTSTPDGGQEYQGTDWDLFTNLSILCQGHAVIDILDYKNLRPSSLRSDQRLVPGAGVNRHGQFLRFVSHLDSLSFSVLIMDYMVIQSDKMGRGKVGAPRSFAVVDDYGNLYKGWSGLEWDDNHKVARFAKEKGLEASPGNIKFKYFMTPSFAQLFYSQKNLVFGVIEARRIDEFKHYTNLADELRQQRVRLPPPPDDEKVVYIREDARKATKVPNLEAKVFLPDGFNNTYPYRGIGPFRRGETPRVKIYTGMPTKKNIIGQQEILRYCKWHLKKLAYKYGPMIRVPKRAIELAFYLYGFKNPEREPGSETRPTWDIPEWERNFKETPRARNRWNRLNFGEVQLLYRITERTVERKARDIPIYGVNGSGYGMNGS